MFISFLPEYSPTDFAVSHYGPESEYAPQNANANPSFQSAKHQMIIRMLRSDAFISGQMSHAEIAKVTQVQAKLVKKIHRDLQR
ncbi:MAG: hypothetical protein AAFQ87_12785 [Bacteroidota bacterium]